MKTSKNFTMSILPKQDPYKEWGNIALWVIIALSIYSLIWR